MNASMSHVQFAIFASACVQHVVGWVLQVQIAVDPAATVQIPVASNAKKIERGTQLVMLDDLNLLKVSKSLKEAAANKPK